MRCAGAIDPCPNCVDYKVLRDSPARNSPKTSAETPDPILGSPGASAFFRKGTDIMGLSRGKAEKLVLWYLRLAPGCHSSPYKARDFWAVLVKLSFEINLQNFGLNPFARWVKVRIFVIHVCQYQLTFRYLYAPDAVLRGS